MIKAPWRVRCVTKGSAGKLSSTGLTTAMNVLGRPPTWRGVMATPVNHKGVRTFHLSEANKCRGDFQYHCGIFKLFGRGCGGNGADYHVSETGTSEMSGSGRNFPGQLRNTQLLMGFHENNLPK